MTAMEQQAINAIRLLSVDMINKANSGHPGLPLGAAPMAYTLFTRFLRVNPKDPEWTNRDRFVLSAGHGSAMLYSLLHLSGFDDLSLDQLKAFRQLGSKTPGHPEVGHTRGVDASTGPLGQGVSNAVGMAMAEAHLAALFNTEDHTVVDHYTYALVGDGDLMEGVSAEAASLAGHLGLGKLIVLYDSNDISLDGETAMAFTEQVGERFRAYGWDVSRVEDGNDIEAIDQAIRAAQSVADRPSLIEVKTVIGYGSSLAGTSAVHGAPLGEEKTAALRETLGWTDAPFVIDDAIYAHFAERVAQRGADAEAAWQAAFHAYADAHPDKAVAYRAAFAQELPADWDADLPVWHEEDKPIASRSSSGKVIQTIAKRVPTFWGGSADLSGSNKTQIETDSAFSKDDRAARNIWYGVREFAMAAINNGIALHGGTKVFGSTFFVFSDYMRGAVRVAALAEQPVTYVMTHDSVAVGEDGPTHEPIEQLASWRAMPNLDVIRPADANEVVAAWRLAMLSTDHPTMLVLSRQNLPNLPHTDTLAKAGVEQGAYVLSPAEGEADGILIGTGSEVSVLLDAQERLNAQGIAVSVVSMPSTARFDRQPQEVKDAVLPPHLRHRLSLEAGATLGWARYVGLDGVSLGIDRFGLSAPGEEAMAEVGMTAEAVVDAYVQAFGA